MDQNPLSSVDCERGGFTWTKRSENENDQQLLQDKWGCIELLQVQPILITIAGLMSRHQEKNDSLSADAEGCCPFLDVLI